VAETKRKTAQEVADENLATAERVLEKATARVAKTMADASKAVADEKMAKRRVLAAQMLAGVDETLVADDETAGDDVI
jgi:hypothetical protein